MTDNPWDLHEEDQAEPINTQELDAMVVEMKELEDDYRAKKQVSTDAYNEWQKKRLMVLDTLKKANKKKYPVDGVGTVSVVKTAKYKMPADPGEKEKFFKWLQEYGKEVYFDYATVNYNKFNSFCKNEVALAAERGEVLDIPGVDLPTEETEIRFRKG